MKIRRKARLRALQFLYAYEISGNTPEQIFDDPIWEEPIDERSRKFCEELIKETIKDEDKFDELIKKKSKNWKFERITLIDKLILRLSICEFLNFSEIPPKVSIDEALEISKIFSTEKSSKFINGILDSILIELKNEGRICKERRGLIDEKCKTVNKNK